MTEKMFFKKYVNLSKNELNTKNNKEGYAKNDVWLLLLNFADVKKRDERKIEGYKKNWWVQNLNFQNAKNTKSDQK